MTFVTGTGLVCAKELLHAHLVSVGSLRGGCPVPYFFHSLLVWGPHPAVLRDPSWGLQEVPETEAASDSGGQVTCSWTVSGSPTLFRAKLSARAGRRQPQLRRLRVPAGAALSSDCPAVWEDAPGRGRPGWTGAASGHSGLFLGICYGIHCGGSTAGVHRGAGRAVASSRLVKELRPRSSLLGPEPRTHHGSKPGRGAGAGTPGWGQPPHP